MKTKLLIALFIILNVSSFSQSISQISTEIYNDSNEVDCTILPTKAADLIAEHYYFIDKKLSYDSVLQIINFWTENCELTEPLLRLQILISTCNGKPTDSLINMYYEKQFAWVFKNKMKNAKNPDYKSIYENDKAQYGYIPIKHLFDDFTNDLSGTLLNKELSDKERIICLLFNYDFLNEEPSETTYTNNNPDPIAANFEIYQSDYSWGIWGFSTGVWIPRLIIGKSVSPNFMFGVNAGLQKSKFFFELEANARFHESNYDFDFVVDRDTFAVNSSVAAFFGFNTGFKLIQNNVVGLYAIGGLGIDWMNTDLFKEEKYNEDTDEYYDINYSLVAPHLYFGLSLLIWNNYKNIFRVNTKYHFTPVSSSKIISELPSSAYSVGIQFVF
ncbi:MAG: hypothetical protein JEZ09_01615 [Salinivirgaceae bacterium]|nr:hypothetical protein [Salinivirgaceae bacterium]